MSDNTTPATPAGWYPDQADPSAVRYWDGAQWTEHTQPAAGYVGSDTPGTAGAPAAVLVPAPKKPWYKRPGPLIAAGAGVLVLLFILIGALNGGTPDTVADPKPSSTRETLRDQKPVEEVEEPEPVDTTVEVPDMVGMTVAEAVAALAAVDITLELPAEVGQDWVVSSQTVAGGQRIEPGDPLSISAAPPAPVYTLAQENVIRQAKSYLAYSGFSRAGLIGQLEYEGYSTEDATFGADNAGADWNAEAAEKAKSYLEYSSFSRQGLYDQMAYEEFTPEQIEFALAAVGY